MHTHNFILTKRLHSNNIWHCYQQCIICGVSKTQKKPENFERLPVFNENLVNEVFDQQNRVYQSSHKKQWNGIQPIITKYKGIDFRSRMEARTAVFLDALGIKWEYEKEGYEIDNGNSEIIRYLPDFYIPVQGDGSVKSLDYFIEVKGIYPTNDEINKACLLAVHTRKDVFFVYNFPYFDVNDLKRLSLIENHILAIIQESLNENDVIAECRVNEKWVFYKDKYFDFQSKPTNDDDIIKLANLSGTVNAYSSARNAKFEF